MNALFKKEIRYFFTSAIGYVVIGAFMLFSGLFLWVLSGEYNIFQTGFASLQPFFLLSAWIFVFLVPALTMRIISEEKRSGMLPLLFTYPISVWRIVLAKYLSVLAILLILLAFSGVYIYMVWQLGAPKGNIDMASTIGSYIALFLLGATFVAVGMFASAMSQNQIIAFVIATFLNFFLFFGLDELIGLFTPNSLFSFGFKVHFEDISRGVIDTRNIVYFSCFIFFFLYLTQLSLQTEKKMKSIKKPLFSICLLLLLLGGIIGVSQLLYKRFDLTSDKRYTLSPTTLQLLSKVKAPIDIKVLLKGNIPAEYKRLQTETLQLLEEYKAANKHIHFEFVNPLQGKDVDSQLQALSAEGFTPLMITSSTGATTSEEYIIPWAIITKGDKQERVPLLRNKLGASSQEKIQFSVQNLEYAFSDALYKLFLEKQKNIAVIRSNGTLADIQIADFLRLEQQYYHLAPFVLDSVATAPEKTLKQLSEFQLCIIAKPTIPFTDEQKQVLDQYIMNGGRVLWLLDPVAASLEELFRQQGRTMAMPLNLNLTDMLFKYGVRLNYDLINDWYFTQIVVAQGSGSQTQYTPIPWVYSPMILSANNHMINKNLDGIRLQFVSSIDTLSNGIKKSILLTSSPLSKTEGTPREIILDFPEKTTEGYEKGNFPVAVLLEGSFTSAFKNRVKPIAELEDKDQSVPNKMIVISDGDIIRNDIQQGVPTELGYDKWTNQYFDNKAFLQNCVNYLLDDTAFLSLRNKKVSLAFLDKKILEKEATYWKSIAFIVPLLTLTLLGLGVRFWYKKRFS